MTMENAKSMMVGRAHNYAVHADGGREFSSRLKSKAMSVAKAWRRAGLRPQCYAIGDDAEGRVTIDRIPIA